MASTLDLFTTFLLANLFAILPIKPDLFTYMIHCLMFFPFKLKDLITFPSLFVVPVSLFSSMNEVGHCNKATICPCFAIKGG